MRTAGRAAFAIAPLLMLGLSESATSQQSRGDRSESETHVYYVAAEPVRWDYAPSGESRTTGARFDTSPARLTEVPRSEDHALSKYYNVRETTYAPGAREGLETTGRVYEKVLYRAYTDSTFRKRSTRPPEWEHAGLLRPVLTSGR